MHIIWASPLYPAVTTEYPVRGNRFFAEGVRAIPITDPLLLRQWHHSKNGSLTPDLTTPGSHKKVWWRCEKGHEWQAEIKSRTLLESGCPYCAGKVTVPGENDLATLRPDLAAQWHVGKNGSLTPRDVPAREPQKSLVAVQQGPRMASHCRLQGQRRGLPGVRREGGHLRGERSCLPVPGDRRAVGQGAQRRADGGDRLPLQQPKGVVAVPARPPLASRHLRPDLPRDRVPLLRRAAGAGGVQRPCLPRPQGGTAVASHAERAPYPGAGDGGEPAVRLVAVCRGPCLESPHPQQNRQTKVRLPGLCRAGQGEPEISLRIHMGGPTRKRRRKPCLIYHARTQNIHV